MKVDYRERILEESYKLFLKYGISETGVADIADAVGISKGTLYYHFKSKNAIIDEIASRYFAKMDRMFAAVVSAQPLGVKMTDMAELVINVMKDNVETELLHYVLLAYGVIAYPELKDRFKEKYSEWLNIIKQCLDNIEVSSANEFYSQLIFSSIEGISIRNILGMDNVNIDIAEMGRIIDKIRS